MKKRELEEWEKAECLALKQAVEQFNAGKPRAEALSQGKIADALGINQGSVSAYLNGYNALNLKVAAVIGNLISCPLEKFSPRLAEEYARLARSYSWHGPQWTLNVIRNTTLPNDAEPEAELLGDMVAWEEGDPLDEQDCAVPYYAEVEFSGGNGMTEVVEVAERSLRFSRATLRAAGVDPGAAACARVHGKSMEKLILQGAAIGFDRSDTSIIDGEIYAFNQGGLLRVKYLYRMPAGAVRIRSENEEEWPDEFMTAERYHEEVQMLGRVFWWSTVRRSPKRK